MGGIVKQKVDVFGFEMLNSYDRAQYWHRTEHLIGPRGSQTRSNLNRAGLG